MEIYLMSSLSIIIPCLNEERYIKSCIDSILSANLEGYAKEIIFVDGGSLDRTVEIIEEYQKNYPFIKLLHNPKKFTPVSMNMGIEASNGEYIFIISAHAEYQEDYFNLLVKEIKRLDANCVGGVLKTEVKNSNSKSNSIKAILTHRFGVGNADFRTGGERVKEVDTVAFGCYTKETFKKFGLYDEKLIRNQDIELNKRIINGGGKIYLIPDVKCTYFARENFTALAKNNFANGKWNILTAYYTKTLNSLSLRHFIPLIFVLSLLLPILLSLFFTQIILVSILSLSSYLALVIIISFNLREKNSNLFYLIGSFLTLHLSYGFGSLIGVFSIIKKYIKGNK
jgi:glycosyltransferase involved in cell wall biosynthesis